MIEVFLENQQIDISNDISALLTFCVDDISHFGSKNTSFSKTIVLPGTGRNNKIFGHIFEINTGSFYTSNNPNVGYNFNASKGSRCLIFQGNIQVFKGTLRVMEVIVDKGVIEYEVAVFGELGGFTTALQNKKLEDLDFSAYDHTYNDTNITASWDDIEGEGYYYPLIDYGTYGSSKHDWDIRTFRPALYAKEYIDKIFAQAGYTYDCALFSTDRFKSLIVPHNQKELTILSGEVLDIGGGSSQSTSGTGESHISLPLNTQTLIGSFSASAGNTIYTYNASATISIDIVFDMVYGLNNNTGNTNQINVTLNGNSIRQVFLHTGSNNVLTTRINNITLSQNDTLQVVWSAYALGFFPTTLGVVSSRLHLFSSIMVPVVANIGDTVRVNSTIPKNISQINYFSSILKLFNLYVVDDKFKSNHLVITPYIDFYDLDPSTAQEWTYKLNRAKPIRIKPLSELNARVFEFRFKPDTDHWNDTYKKRYNEGYGDRTFDSEYEFAKESEKLEVIFSSTPLIGYSGEDKVYSTILKLTGSTEERVDSNIRILQAKKIEGVSSWDIKNSGSTVATLTDYGYAGHLDDPDAPTNDLNFGAPKELFFTLLTGSLTANQFNVYYSPYMAEITDKDSKLLTASFYLNTKDINELDFSKFIYLDGGLFRLNKVIDWNATNPDECRCELLKVVNTLY